MRRPRVSVSTSELARIRACSSSSCFSSMPISVTLNCKVSTDGSEENDISVVGDNFSVYPNPTKGELSVSFNSSVKEKYLLKVTDISGKTLVNEIHNAEEGNNTQELDLRGVAQGMYFISIERESGENRTIRIIVDREY